VTPAVPAHRSPEAPAWAGLDVLIVEDHADSADALRQALEAEGARAWLAVDGLEALERLARGVPDVVLSDVRMPRLDGLGLVARIRRDARWGHLAVVALTAYNTPDDVRATRDAGFDGHVTKPVDFDLLTGTVRRALATRQAARPRPRG
jgi:CheY-like chemotaxis protein